jgi:hypothetical protein
MTRFKAKIWKSGTSNVVTFPMALVGVDYQVGDEIILEIQPKTSRAILANQRTFMVFNPQPAGVEV